MKIKTISKRINWQTYKNKKILENDLSDLTPEEFTKQMLIFERMILNLGETDICVYSDIRGASYNTNSIEELKRIAFYTKPYISKYAVIGVTGIKKIIFKAVKPFATAKLNSFPTIEKAKTWLIK